MRSSSLFLVLFLAGLLSPVAAVAADAAKPPALSFDLFGFPVSAAELNLGQRIDTLRQAIFATFPQEAKKQPIQVNSYSGRCFLSGSDLYRLSWMDSETEGFRFTVDLMKNQKTCQSWFTEGVTLPSGPINPQQFFPISRSHPQIQLGVSTPEQIRKELGKPAYASSDLLIYTLKRDREKEKGCQYEKGQLAVVGVQFHFSKGILSSVDLINDISGEC